MSTTTLPAPPARPCQLPVDALGTDARRGLSEGEARTRLERDGRNELTLIEEGDTIP